MHILKALFSAEVLVASCDFTADFTYKEEGWKNCSVLGGWGRCKTDGPYNFSDELIFTSNIAAINLMQTSPRETSRGLEISTAKENL